MAIRRTPVRSIVPILYPGSYTAGAAMPRCGLGEIPASNVITAARDRSIEPTPARDDPLPRVSAGRPRVCVDAGTLLLRGQR